MRRTSVFLALAAIFLTVVVGFTYWFGLQRTRTKPHPAPKVTVGLEAVARRGWHYQKDDPVTNRPITRVDADSFQGTKDPSTFELIALKLRLYNKSNSSYTLVAAQRALFDEGSGLLKSAGPVSIVMNVPVAVDPNDTKELNKRVHVETSGVTYETKSGKASTDQLATFVFPQGGGHAVGADYDPNTRVLHLKSAISLDWIGSGPVANKVHVETADLVYKELEQKIYLSPWSKMQRQTLTINAQSSVVSIEDGRLHQIDSVNAVGTDDRNGRKVNYSADNMTAMFDEDGVLTEVIGDKHAHITSTTDDGKTIINGDRADLVFQVTSKIVNNVETSDSELHAVTADGHAVAESHPLPVPGVLQADNRILRSEHILLTMKPGGKDVQEINSPTKSNLEFIPNRPGLPHRTLDAAKLHVVYGDGSYIQSLTAANVKTRTDKPPDNSKPINGKPPEPSFTWSDQMVAKFKTGSNQIESIDQTGHFRYEEGDRKASSQSAQLLQDINRITLKDRAHVLDNTGSTYADLIVMDQANGDMDASGHVRSTRQPDKNQKPGTSMLDATKSMQAEADKMVSRENNTQIAYTGHAVVWQGANRISADVIKIDRDDESLVAHGDVVSELVDNRDNSDSKNTADAKTATEPMFTVVRAPDLTYHDDTRIALYTGGVTLVRDHMTVTSDRMRAFLTPKTDNNSNQSSLDHAIADGDVKIFDKVNDMRTRTGSSQHCEYYTKDDKVVLSGGSPQFVDSQKGLTKGKLLTYYSDDDKLIVEGEPTNEAFTRMKKK